MKSFILSMLVALVVLSPPTLARTLEIEVHGMTCAFCVDSLERKFKQMDNVAKVEVSLKQNKIRIETSAKQPSIAIIKQAVLETGFTPIKVTILSE